jgi:hypothetical protein
MTITKEYLRNHPNEIFVFGDNLQRAGLGGAAYLRNEPNTYGFVTKKLPNKKPASYYEPQEYAEIYWEEIDRLKKTIIANPNKIYLISKIGAGLANLNHIFELVIEPNIKNDLDLPNVKFLW